MKHIHILLSLIVCSILEISCVGQKEEVSQENIQIIANKEAILIGQDESVSFQVFFNELDITDECEIFVQTDGQDFLLENRSFIPKEPGTFYFYAQYKGIPTSSISILVLPNEVSPEGNFYRRTLITKFTATWCVNCPKMSDAIKMVEQNNPNRVIDMAVHYIDELEVTDGKELAEQFSVSALPVTVVNLNKNALTSVSSSTILQNYVDEALNHEMAASGIKITSYDQDNQLHVDIETTIAADGEYKLAVALVEDEIKRAQIGAGADYIHHSVLKDMLQENTEGEELGECRQGDILTFQYQYPTNLLNKEGKYRIIAYIMHRDTHGSYITNNVISGRIKENTDYQYE